MLHVLRSVQPMHEHYVREVSMIRNVMIVHKCNVCVGVRLMCTLKAYQ